MSWLALLLDRTAAFWQSIFAHAADMRRNEQDEPARVAELLDADEQDDRALRHAISRQPSRE